MNKLIDEKIFFFIVTSFITWLFLDHSIYKMVVRRTHFVKSAPLRALCVSFQYFVNMLQTY